MKLAVDASVAVAASANPLGFERFRRYELVAPSLIWIESVSTLHAMVWRGELRSEQAESMRDRVLAAPVRRREPTGSRWRHGRSRTSWAGPRPTTRTTSPLRVF